MPETRYHIIFSALVEGRQPAQVYHELAGLFRIDQEQVQQIFALQGAVVKSDLDRAAAEQYMQVILAAGAICVIEPMPSGGRRAASLTTRPLSEAQDEPGRQEEEKEPEPLLQDKSPAFRQLKDESSIENRDMDGLNVRVPVFAAVLLLVGACLPVASGSAELYWPWQFAFEPKPPGLLWWVILPIASFCLLALLRAPAFGLIVACVGVVTLLGTTVVLWEAALILPLRILPFDRASALAYVLPLLGAAVCSAACRAMHDLGELVLLRLLGVCGGLAVLVPTGVALFSADGAWGHWPMILLLLLLLLYAVMALACSCLRSVSESMLRQTRLLGMLLLCWGPLAVFLAHLPLPESESSKPLLLAVLKAALLYYGSLAAVAGGLRTELLYRFEKQSRAHA